MSDFETGLLEKNLDKSNIDNHNSMDVEDEYIKNNGTSFEDRNSITEKIDTDENGNVYLSTTSDISSDPGNQAPNVNCLYLTVKKDYSLSIFRNKIKKVIKGSWKIVVSIFVLNFLSSFL